MTTNNFKKAMALSVVPAVSLGLFAIPANAQEETDAVSETAENTINLKISGIDRDREANVQLVNGEDKVVAEKTVKRNGARVSFDYNSEDIVDGILTVAVDGETYTTIGAKCTAQSDKEENTEEPTVSEEPTSENTPDAAPSQPESSAPAPEPAPSQPESPEVENPNTSAGGDTTDTPAGDTTGTPSGDTTGGESGSGGLLGGLGALGGLGGLLNQGLGALGGSEGISNMINDSINNFVGGEGGSIDPGRILDIISQGAQALPQNADENINEDYVKAIEIAANTKDSKISDKEAKDLNLEGTEKETAEGFAKLGKIYAEGLEEYAGTKTPTDAQINEYNEIFTDALVEEIESDEYLLKELAGKVLDSPLGDMAINAGAAAADGFFPGAGGAVRTIGGGLKDRLADRLNGGDSEESTGTENTGNAPGGDAPSGGTLAGGADAAPTENTDTNTSAGTAPAENSDAPSDTTGGTNADTDTSVNPAGGSDTVVTSTATPTEVETTGSNIELELEVGDYTIDIFNADDAQLINCSVELLADEFDDEDVFSEIPTPVAKPEANANANKGPLQPAPRAVAPASAAGAYGPKVDTGGQVETSFVTTLIDFFTKQ